MYGQPSRCVWCCQVWASERICALQSWLVDYFYLIAGILFLLAGSFYCMHESSIYLVPGESSHLTHAQAASLQ